MACEEFEDRLIDYSDLTASERNTVDSHMAACNACRDYLDTVNALDLQLARHYSAVQSPAAFEQRVHGRVVRQVESSRLTMLPELLDFAGWTAVIAALAGLALLLPLPDVRFSPRDVFFYTVFAAAVAAVAGAVWAGVRSYAEMNR